MLKWRRGKTVSKGSAASPELDFRNPDAEKFAASLDLWRKSLEAKRSQDTKLDQNELTFMAPEALAELKELETARRKATAAKTLTATLKAKAKEATTTEKPAAKKPATAKSAVKKSAAKPAAKKAAPKPVAKKPTAVKAPAKKPAETKAAVKKAATKTASTKAPAKPVAKKVTTAVKKPAAKPKTGTKTNKA